MVLTSLACTLLNGFSGATEQRRLSTTKSATVSGWKVVSGKLQKRPKNGRRTKASWSGYPESVNQECLSRSGCRAAITAEFAGLFCVSLRRRLSLALVLAA
jgi:hypothetical protein